MHFGQGLEAFFTAKNYKNRPATSPARQPSPAKAASSVYTGAGPIRACYNAGYDNHRRHASQVSALQTHLCEWPGERVHAARRLAHQTRIKREPRTLVVCGTSVRIDRSSPTVGTLRTRQGRTFAVIPKSTSHTSPRGGVFNSTPRGGQAPGTRLQRRAEAGHCWVPCKSPQLAGAKD